MAGGITATVLIKDSPETSADETSDPAEDNGPPDQNVLVQKITGGNVTYGSTRCSTRAPSCLIQR